MGGCLGGIILISNAIPPTEIQLISGMGVKSENKKLITPSRAPMKFDMGVRLLVSVTFYTHPVFRGALEVAKRV